MTDKAAFKVGDRVRATCGESVLVGEVGALQAGEVAVAVDAGRLYWIPLWSWTVEVITPPPWEGALAAVVTDHHGTSRWIRPDTRDRWYCVRADGSASTGLTAACLAEDSDIVTWLRPEAGTS